MARPHDVDYLQPDETMESQTRRHTLSAVDTFLGLTALWLLLLGFGTWLTWRVDGIAANVVTAAVVVTVAYVLGMVLVHWRRATSLYTVTGERVYMAYGRLRFHLLQTTYDKVTDLHVHQSLFGRIWGYGTVRVQTAGTGLALAGVSDPLTFKKTIEAQRSRFLRSLVQTATRSKKRVAAPETATRRWEGRPSPASLLGAFIPVAFLLLGSLVLLFVGLFVEVFLLAFSAGLFLFAALVALAQWIQYRYTRYEVTTRGVVVTKGWLSRRRVEATFAKVTDVSVDQDILARILGYGKITINTAGSNEAPVVFAGIARPDDVKATIDAARGDQG